MCGSRVCVGATGKGRGFVCGGSAWVGAWFDRYRWGMVTTILMGPIGQCASSNFEGGGLSVLPIVAMM